MQQTIPTELYQQFLGHLIKGEKSACGDIVDALIKNGTKIKTIYNQLFRDSLYEVGHKWEKNEISVATEHLATALTENLMNKLYPYLFSQEHKNRKAIITSGANEYHQIGGRMVADIIELNGWDSYYLGANTPLLELMRMIEDKKPDIVGISISMFYNLPKLREYFAQLHRHFPELDIIVGGHAFTMSRDNILSDFPTVKQINTLDALEVYLNKEYAQ